MDLQKVRNFALLVIAVETEIQLGRVANRPYIPPAQALYPAPSGTGAGQE